MADGEDIPAFNLPGSDGGFASRSSDVFGNLQVLEQKHLAFQRHRESSGEAERDEKLWKTDPDEDVKKAHKLVVPEGNEAVPDPASKLRQASDYCSSRDRANFKRPDLPGPRKFGRFTPDFKKHPEKWTKYSLEDVDARDMSERSNTQAALAFLEERRRLREGQIEEDRDEGKLNENACSKGRISFSKPARDAGKPDEEKGILFRKPRKKHSGPSSSSSGGATEKSTSRAAQADSVEDEDEDDEEEDGAGDDDGGDDGASGENEKSEARQATADKVDDDGDVSMTQGRSQEDSEQEKSEDKKASAPETFKGRKSQKRSIRMRYYEDEEEEEEEGD